MMPAVRRGLSIFSSLAWVAFPFDVAAGWSAAFASPPVGDGAPPDAAVASAIPVKYYEIGGVLAGMTPEATVAALKHHDPQIVLRKLMTRGYDGKPRLLVIVAEHAGELYAADAILVFFTEATPEVVEIVREQNYPTGKEPTSSTFRASVQQRYGLSLSEDLPETAAVNTLADDTADPTSQCATAADFSDVRHGSIASQYLRQPLFRDMHVSSSPKNGCGISFVVTAYTSPTAPGVVVGATQQLLDQKLATNDEQEVKSLIAKLAALRDEAAEKARRANDAGL